jgi:hypothetical protein
MVLWLRIVLALSLTAAVFVPAFGADESGVSFSISRRSAPLQATLPTGQPIYFAVEYESDKPVRFQAKALTQDKKVQYHNATAIYPAGKGIALAWCSMEEPAKAASVLIAAFDEDFNMLASRTFPANVAWTGAPASVLDTPEWAAQLIALEETMEREPALIEPGGFIDNALFLFVALSIPGYLLLQLIAPTRLEGVWKRLALVPLIAMAPAGVHAAYAASQGSNVWVFAVVFGAPIAFVWQLGVLIASRFRAA